MTSGHACTHSAKPSLQHGECTRARAHTAWKWRKARIRFPLCLSLREPPGQQGALDVSEPESLEATPGNRIERAPLFPARLSPGVKVPCPCARVPLGDSGGGGACSCDRRCRRRSCGCCSTCAALKDEQSELQRDTAKINQSLSLRQYKCKSQK